MFKGLVIGVVIGVVLVTGSLYYYFVSGMAPAAVSDPLMPFERKLASRALHAHIDNAHVPAPLVPANDENLVPAAKLYRDNCAVCHGLPDQTPPKISDNMFPHATLMFKDEGVTDDPPQESYWKIANGIRLTGMPSFKATLSDIQMWQLAQLVATADKMTDPVKKAFAPEPPAAPMASAPAPAAAKAAGSKK